MMHIRKAEIDDLAEIMKIYGIAQDFMIKSGNPTQWGRSYPGQDLIKEDIENEVCHLICDGETPHGVFALFRGDEPTYQYIEGGEWLNDEAYVTVHRIASDGKVRGVFKCAIDHCKAVSDNIRIDTHKSNKIMQKLIEKNGFQRCGTIYVRNAPRIAYQWCKDE
jgi:hypothetical protein